MRIPTLCCGFTIFEGTILTLKRMYGGALC